LPQAAKELLAVRQICPANETTAGSGDFPMQFAKDICLIAEIAAGTKKQVTFTGVRTTPTTNATELWRRMRTQGFRGSRRVVSEWATRRKRTEKADAETLNRIPSARAIARLLTISRDNLTKYETVIIAAIEGGVPLLVKARDIIAEFHRMMGARRKTSLRRG
jgi:hypothetical protein